MEVTLPIIFKVSIIIISIPSSILHFIRKYSCDTINFGDNFLSFIFVLDMSRAFVVQCCIVY